MKKRVLSLLLCTVLCLTLLPGTALAGTNFSVNKTALNGGAKNVAAPIVLNHNTVFYVTADTTVTNTGANANGDLSALAVDVGATAVLYIPQGVTLTVYGHDAIGRNGAGAGIRVPEGATLIITGGGSLAAYGGNGEDNNAPLCAPGHGGNPIGSTTGGSGGKGGDGGGGAGAGIGGRGGNGGQGGAGGAGGTNASRAGKNGSAGQDGDPGELCGTVYLLLTNHTLLSGAFGYATADGGLAGTEQQIGSQVYEVIQGGGGGGAGSPGQIARQSGTGSGNYPIGIGSGGGGGGGGGGGAGGSYLPGQNAQDAQNGQGATSRGDMQVGGAGGGAAGASGGEGGDSVRYAVKKEAETATPDAIKYTVQVMHYDVVRPVDVNVVLGEAPPQIAAAGTPPKGYALLGYYDYYNNQLKLAEPTGAWVQPTDYVDGGGRWQYAGGKLLRTKTAPIQYSVSYDLGVGGAFASGYTAPGQATYDAEMTVQNPVSNPPSHVFKGWYLKGNADYASSGAQYSTDGTTWLRISSASLLCAAGTSNVLFKNLTATDGGAVTLEAVWEDQTPEHTISVSASPAAGGTVSGGGTYDEGHNLTVTAAPNTNYHFVKWTENGSQVSTSASYVFQVTAARTLVAEFEENPPDPAVTQPTTDRTVPVTAGNTVTLSVAAEHAESYQWRVDRGSGFTDISGAVNASYTTAPVTLQNSGYRYVCVVSGAPDTRTATSPVFTLLVTEKAAVPATGDAQKPLLWLCAAALSAAVLAARAALCRRRRPD